MWECEDGSLAHSAENCQPRHAVFTNTW